MVAGYRVYAAIPRFILYPSIFSPRFSGKLCTSLGADFFLHGVLDGQQ